MVRRLCCSANHVNTRSAMGRRERTTSSVDKSRHLNRKLIVWKPLNCSYYNQYDSKSQKNALFIKEHCDLVIDFQTDENIATSSPRNTTMRKFR